MLFRQVAIKDWPNAYHVYDNDDRRIGIVNCKAVRVNGKIDRIVWYAHNSNFFSVPGEYSSRTAAAEAIPRGPVHQPIGAFSGRSLTTT